MINVHLKASWEKVKESGVPIFMVVCMILLIGTCAYAVILNCLGK